MSKKSKNKSVVPKRARTWCFTSFNMGRTPAFIFNEEDSIKFLVIGNEKATTTQRKHYQGHVTFFHGKTLKPAQETLGLGYPHMEIVRDVPASIRYCKKEHDWVSYGKPPKQGKRTDMDDMKELIDDGTSKGGVSEIILWEKNFGLMVRYHKSMRRYKFLCETKLARVWRNVHVSVFYGSTGSGKTRAAEAAVDFSIKASGIKWWDSYEFSMKSVLVDEFNNNWRVDKTLALMDGAPMLLENKGGHVWAGYTNIIFTTNLQPQNFHGNASQEHRLAIDRRVDEWVNYDTMKELVDTENDIIMM